MSVVNKIKSLQTVNTFSKHEHLVKGIINSIDSKILTRGDQLPSINTMVRELGYARKTIVKAYEELKSRGIVESKQFKGYYISSEDTQKEMKVALILYAFQSFQEVFYNTFRDDLGENVQVDVFFHHNNVEVFETIISNVYPKYGMYVIAPVIDDRVPCLLSPIPPEKLFLVDRFIPMENNCSSITQEFEHTTYRTLVELLPAIQKYKEFIIYCKEGSDYPIGILRGFERFVADYKINGIVKNDYVAGTVKKGSAYFMIRDTILWEILKDCKDFDFEVGKDVGILGHNENILKEIVSGGITTMSTDFKRMAQMAAEFVAKKEQINIVIPSVLIRRNSL